MSTVDAGAAGGTGDKNDDVGGVRGGAPGTGSLGGGISKEAATVTAAAAADEAQRDFYDVLGLSVGASPEEIKVCMKVHSNRRSRMTDATQNPLGLFYSSYYRMNSSAAGTTADVLFLFRGQCHKIESKTADRREGGRRKKRREGLVCPWLVPTHAHRYCCMYRTAVQPGVQNK